MTISRKSTSQFTCILFLLGIMFFLILILTPSVYNQTGNSVSGKSLSGSMTDKDTPINHVRSFIITILIENEILTDVTANHTINRSLQEGRKLITIVSYILAVLLTGYGVLVHYKRYLIRETDQNLSLIAISKGGHAPPQAIQL
ncbi:MAG: hypothetical protein PHF63_09365 [Herbinix sp.]|nr:hypothetical protein [Herbinix sp.]